MDLEEDTDKAAEKEEKVPVIKPKANAKAKDVDDEDEEEVEEEEEAEEETGGIDPEEVRMRLEEIEHLFIKAKKSFG